MTRNPPPVLFCSDCGRRLIRKHTVLMRRDDSQYAVYRSFEKEVPPRCIYGGVHESDARAKRRVVR